MTATALVDRPRVDTRTSTHPLSGVLRAGRPLVCGILNVTPDSFSDGGLVGDVDGGSVTGRAAGLTPVPGGVGPVTTALLLQHTVTSARG